MATRGWNDVTAADVAKMGRKATTLPQVRTSGRSKYGAVKTVVDGVTFDSKAEARRYTELKQMERAGLIDALEIQPVFEIYIDVSEIGDGHQHICDYRADFAYWLKRNNVRVAERVVEDVKGMKTPVYRLKKKLVEAIYGIRITEIR